MKKTESSRICWAEIGIAGNAGCPRLSEYIHCRNCPVYTESGRGLLDREMPEGYLDEWTELLARVKESAFEQTLSVLVFRVGAEWLALPTGCFSRIAPERPIHPIPHRSGKILRGLVNIDGELLLAVALEDLLGVEPAAAAPDVGELSAARMLVMQAKDRRWAFRVDAVDAIHHVDAAKIVKPPVTAAKAAVSFTAGLLDLPDKTAALLREEAVTQALSKVVNS